MEQDTEKDVRCMQGRRYIARSSDAGGQRYLTGPHLCHISGPGQGQGIGEESESFRFQLRWSFERHTGTSTSASVQEASERMISIIDIQRLVSLAASLPPVDTSRTPLVTIVVRHRMCSYMI